MRGSRRVTRVELFHRGMVPPPLPLLLAAPSILVQLVPPPPREERRACDEDDAALVAPTLRDFVCRTELLLYEPIAPLLTGVADVPAALAGRPISAYCTALRTSFRSRRTEPPALLLPDATLVEDDEPDIVWR